MSMSANLMGKRKRISLRTSFSRALNQPRYVKGAEDFPLYPHGENSKVALSRSEGWHKMALTTYNSPSNVRTVCLSQDGANVLYWAQPIKGGKVSPSFEAAGEYIFDKSIKTRQLLDATKFSWDNAGLSALVDPVVFSNMEELWVTSEIFNCPKYANIYATLSNLQPGQVVSVNSLAGILEEEIKRTIAKTFPLLRAIVVVKVPQGSMNLDFHKCAIRSNRAKELLEAKFPGQRRAVGECADYLKEVAQQTGLAFAVQPITTGSILEFSLGDYKFDEKVLFGVRDKIVKKYTPKPTVVNKEVEAEKTVKEEPKKDVTPKAEEKATANTEQTYDGESLVDVIKAMEAETSNPTVIKEALFALKFANKEFFEQQTPTLSKEMRKKYASVLDR